MHTREYKHLPTFAAYLLYHRYVFLTLRWIFGAKEFIRDEKRSYSTSVDGQGNMIGPVPCALLVGTKCFKKSFTEDEL
jgi:hypothetical protein